MTIDPGRFFKNLARKEVSLYPTCVYDPIALRNWTND